MGHGAPPAALSAAYEHRLELARRRAIRAALAAFLGFESSRSWDDLYGDLITTWLAAQLEGLTLADAMASATLFTHGGTVSRVPLVRSRYLGLSSGGTNVADVVTATQRIVAARMLSGATFAESFMASSGYLTGVIGGDAHRVARDATVEVATTDPRMAGWARYAEPNACRFCRMLATRGAVYKTAETAGRGRRYHPHCRCRVEGVADVVTRQRTIKAGRAEWERLLARGDVPRSARGAQPFATTVNIQRAHSLQLTQLEASIPDLRRRVALGDTAASKPLAWQLSRVEELRRALAVAA